MVDKVVDGFTVSVEGMKDIASKLTQEFEKGLSREGDDIVVKMLITYVHSLPDGTEKGDFLALDLGGSNFRVLLIKLAGGTEVSQIDQKMEIDMATKQGTQEKLFDFIADSVAKFTKDNNIKEKLPLGFTFSFPVHQTSLISGTLIRWTKDFSADGAVGANVVGLLKEAFDRKKIEVDVVALVNDTTGTQLAVGIKDPSCHVGLILGTGTNACYLESLDAIPKFKGDKSRYSQVIVNTEWGAFGDDGETLKPYLTPCDYELDQLVKNKGQQTYEKMISGKYIGELVRLALQSLIKDKLIFGGKSSAAFDTFEAFETKYVSMIESDPSCCKKILKEDFSIEASDEDCVVVKRVCEAVSTRAARLAGAGIVALVRKIKKLDGCTVAVDGSLYKKHPTFRHKMDAAMQELAPGNKIVMKESEDGSGRGAAIVAAVACRLKAAGEYKARVASGMVDTIVQSFSISLDGMRDILSKLTQEFEKGLRKEKGPESVLQMLDTYIHFLPTGNETGQYLAVDLGGSKFRVLLIELDGKGNITQTPEDGGEIEIDISKKQGTQEELFGFIADSVAQFMANHKLTARLPLGFTFSFPVHQTSLTEGTLIKWTKDFSASGAVDKDVVNLLKTALDSKGINVDVVALVNDTTATQLAVRYTHPKCDVGLILGTGTNACYLERDKWPHPVIVNTEWGAFGDDGKLLQEYLTDSDKELNRLVKNNNQQTYEKMISGKYIGELVRLALQSLIKREDKPLFGGKSSPAFDTFEAFETKYVSMIEGKYRLVEDDKIKDEKMISDPDACKHILEETFSIQRVSDEDCEIVARVCEAVSTRAARLAAAGLVAIVRRIGKEGDCVVAVDGSLYKKHPYFKQKMSDAIQELSPGNNIVIVESEHGSGRGAAIAAAAACAKR